MAFRKYTGTNNGQGQVLGGLTAGASIVTSKSGQGSLMPSTYPFRIKIEQFTTGNVTKREILDVTNRSGDILTVTRAVEPCPLTYLDTTMTQTPQSFNDGDTISVVITKDVIGDISDEITRLGTAKIDAAGGTFTGLVKGAKSTNIASATTTDMATANGNFIHITGTTTITAFGILPAGTEITLIFDGILTLTHNGTSLILPAAANITTAVGDSGVFLSEGSGNWRCVSYSKTNGQAISAITNIDGLAENTTILDNDEFVIYDSTNSVNRKIRAKVALTNEFGDGSDGDVTITTTITLARDMYYKNLTITSPGILNANGYKVFVSGTFTTNAGGLIQRNGNNGATTTGGAGGAAGATLNQGSLNAEIAAGAGNTSSGAGFAGGDSNPSYTTTNGAAGGGGAFTAKAGGIATRGTAYNLFYNYKQLIRAALQPASSPIVFPGQYKGAAGSSGGGGGSSGSNGGGGAGTNGGMIWIAANTWNNLGEVQSKGGNGGDGSVAGGGTRGGGGGGGNGGVFVLIYRTLINLGTITLTGGTQGVGGGTAAIAGSAGTSITIAI